MAIAPIAFGDDVARLVREGYEALSGKLNGRTVYRKVISEPILNTQTTKFAILDNSNKVCDIYERAVNECNLLASQHRSATTNFIKLGKDMKPKYTHIAQLVPEGQMRGSQAKGYFSVYEKIVKPETQYLSKELSFVSDTKGQLSNACYTELRSLHSKYNKNYSSKIYTYEDAMLFPKPRVSIKDTGIQGVSAPYHLRKEFESGDILPKYRWRLFSMRDYELYENAARRATGRTL